MLKYCGTCGTQLVKRESYGFNRDTGERNFEMVCPSGKCGHDGCYHDCISTGFFSMIAMGCYSKCTKCGEKFYAD